LEHHSLSSLMIVVAIAFFVPIVLHRFKIKVIPVVVAEIIAGLIIGKSGFNLVSEDEWLSILSTLGFIYLMFLSGLEIDFSFFNKSKKQKKEKNLNSFNPVKISAYIFISILVVSFGLSQLFYITGFIGDPYLFTLIISTISLGVVVPVLKERGMTETPLGQTVLLITVFGDFTTMILLAFYVALKSDSGWSSLLILILFVVVFVSYHIIRRFTSNEFERLRTGTIQLDTRAVFALILMLVVLSETLGVESILGAFLAGVIVSLLSPKKSFVEQLDSFGYGFFIPIFFVMVGVSMELRELLVDPKILILIPILFVAMYVAKVIPALLLKKWYPWRDVLSTGILISSKLSLVIAASAIALKMGFITDRVNGAVILVAVLTCLISPMVFAKMVPDVKKKKKKTISIIGANSITLPVSLDLKKHDEYDVSLYSTEQNKVEPETSKDTPEFPLIELNELNFETLEEKGAFDADIIVVATSYDDWNIKVANHAHELGIKNVIVRVEDAQKHSQLMEQGLSVFSTLYAARTLLKALTEQPSILRLITHHNDQLKEIEILKSKYDGLPLRQLPFLGDALVLQIFRNDEPIIPHGDTELRVGDKLLVSGSKNHLESMIYELQ
jgi:Kef-type K+ transport system membrane component KefB/Trk K+ transport system NAD-binding subunit